MTNIQAHAQSMKQEIGVFIIIIMEIANINMIYLRFSFL